MRVATRSVRAEWMFALMGSFLVPGLAHADEEPLEPGAPETHAVEALPCVDDEDDENPYGREGTWEIGGSLGAHWTPDLAGVNIAPTVGLFLIDYFELSLSVHFDFSSTGDDDDGRNRSYAIRGEIEPSYHLPLIEDDLLLLMGLGLGVGYQASVLGFATTPRAGFNILVGRAGVLTPAVTVPIVIGESQDDSADDGVQVEVGVALEVGFSTAF